MNPMSIVKSAWILGALLSASALSACGANKPADSDDYLTGAPEVSALQLGLTDDAATEGLATADDSIDATEQITESLDESTSALTSQVDPDLANCRAAVRDLNQALRSFLQPIVALVRNTEPTITSSSSKEWGPVTRGATDFRFVMHRGAARHFGWLLEARPTASTAAFSTVAAGGITVGYAARRGVGSVGIDLDTLGMLDPTVAARGSLLASFAHGPSGSTLAYRLHDFTPDPLQKTAVDAVVQGVHLKLGFNRLRLAYYGNVPGSASSADEFVLARVRQLRGIGGRADSLATGGDIVNGKVWVVSECWDGELKSVFRSVRECSTGSTDGTSCNAVSTTGDASACATDVADAELPPSDPNAAMSDPESPEGDVAPPVSMPDGTPPSGA
jgi:hypothetical protein